MENKTLVNTFLDNLKKDHKLLVEMQEKIDIDEDDANLLDEWQTLHVELVYKLNCPYIYNVLYEMGQNGNSDLKKLFEKKEKYNENLNLGADYATLNFDEDSDGFDLNHWMIEVEEIAKAIKKLEENLNDLGEEAIIEVQRLAGDFVMRNLLWRCELHLSDYVDRLCCLEEKPEADLDTLTEEISLILHSKKGEHE